MLENNLPLKGKKKTVKASEAVRRIAAVMTPFASWDLYNPSVLS
jgi:hypothetical protein